MRRVSGDRQWDADDMLGSFQHPWQDLRVNHGAVATPHRNGVTQYALDSAAVNVQENLRRQAFFRSVVPHTNDH